ncbi:MAG: T9SS type A sorting domain-containing protein [Bacteroidia bacterium]|nr:T9SS type A sorting domain-containing protein [Bacteroidia bacterium]
MRFLAALFLACCAVTTVHAQVDTLQYDGITNIYDGKLLAVTRFPGELDVFFNTRFSPAEKCTLTTVLVGFSVVKFQALTGEDTLVVKVFENSAVPPNLVNVVKTYKVNLGDAGFPSPNIRFNNPLEAGARDVLAVNLNPPVIFSPRRDFIVGVKLEAKQKLAVGDGLWNGLTMLFNPGVTEFDRYRRYFIAPNPAASRNTLATEAANIGLFMRAVVSYNPNLPNVDLTDATGAPQPAAFALRQNYPNPFNPSTVLEYTLSSRQHATLTVHDALGRTVSVLADGMMDAGTHSTRFDADGLPAGVYVARLTVNGQMLTRSMLLLK